MRNRKCLISMLLLVSCFNAFSQTFKEQFHAMYTKPDTTVTLNILNNWQKSTPNDPDLYIAFFNFYANRSMTEVINMTTAQSGDKSLVITDPKTNKVVGYLNDGQSINMTLLDRGFKYIDTAIEKFPLRLDMRFGEIYMLGKIPDYGTFTAKLIETINYGKTIDNKWLWADNKALDDGKKFMLSSEQDYIKQLYDAGDDQVNNMKAIAETVLKYYPDNVENLSNLAITYIISKDYPNALVPLLKAEKLAPTDAIVLNNIAFCYKCAGDELNAIKYYELVEKNGNTDEVQNAKKELAALRKK